MNHYNFRNLGKVDFRLDLIISIILDSEKALKVSEHVIRSLLSKAWAVYLKRKNKRVYALRVLHFSHSEMRNLDQSTDIGLIILQPNCSSLYIRHLDNWISQLS